MARGYFDDGFDVVEGNGITLQGNLAEDNYSDGFGVGATGTMLTNNTARNNNANGIRVKEDATNTTLTGNTASGNGRDLCNEGTGTVDGGGNTFTTGGFGADCILE